MEKVVNSNAPVISLIGRTNVGKSTLFNRLQGKMKKAITEDRPGVTRDRHYAFTQFTDQKGGELPLILVDTGGFLIHGGESLFAIMKGHAELAIEESDFILFVVDIREGVLPADREICSYLRAAGKPFAMVINKMDSSKQDGQEGEFYQLGVENVFPVSAAHGLGIGDLTDTICTLLGGKTESSAGGLQEGVTPEGEVAASLCLMGAPNGGKSTLLNRLLRTSRALVSEVAGTTVDPVEGYFKLSTGEGREEVIRVIDTAGIRKKSHIKQYLEQQSVYRALRAIGEANIAICVVDATKSMSHQDRRLVDIALAKGVSVIVVLNKIDLMKFESERDKREWLLDLRAKISWLDFCTVIPISAKEGRHLASLKRALKETVQARSCPISTGKLNRVLSKLTERHPLYVKGGRRQILKVKYAAMVKSSPPTILLFSNRSRNIPSPYRRYLQKGIREAFSLPNTPVRLVFRTPN